MPGNLDINLAVRFITWGDGTQELVQIDKDGFFHLDRVKRRLISFCDPLSFTTDWWETANMALADKWLTYLEGKGIRVYQPSLTVETTGTPSHYNDLLQLAYNHKMLVMPLIIMRGGGDGWDNFVTTDYVITTGKTVSQYMAEWIAHVKTFSNVVAIVLENELDLIESYTYSIPQMKSYMALLHGITRAATSLPIVTKYGFPNDVATIDRENALSLYSQSGCFDIYRSSAGTFTTACNTAVALAISQGKPSQIWNMECNYLSGDYDATLLTKAMIDAQLAANVSLLTLFCTYHHDIPQASFFDASGDPIANCDTLLANLPEWQAAI